MGCHSCGNQGCNGTCVGCSQPCCSCTCDPCNNDCNPIKQQQDCQGGQIEQLKNRTDQLLSYIIGQHPLEEFDALCPVQTCDFCPVVGECGESGSMCTGSPTGKPIGSTCEDPCAPPPSEDCEDLLQAKVRLLGTRVSQLERQIREIRDNALACVLLDEDGMVKGGLTLSGQIKNFQPGSWEAATAP